VTLRGQISETLWLETAVALSLLRSGSDTRAARLLKELTDSSQAPAILDADLPERLAECLAIPPVHRATRLDYVRQRARQILANRPGHQLCPLTSRDAGYPGRLRHISDPPIVLWTRGDVALLSRQAVAIVGSRAATPTALTIARRLGRELAEKGLVVVSGMARGVDAAAHQGALDAEGGTVAVLGSGADVIYPPEHATLATRIAATGVIVSELAPGTPPRPKHFPLRNRIISGVSEAVVVVEASERSGSLITARAALEQGREVLAVPGNVLSGRSRGCHALIRDGARIVETAGDVIEQLRWEPGHSARPSGGTNSLQLNGLEETMAIGEQYTVDDLASDTGRSTAALLAELGTLELSGRIVRTAGGHYVRLD
jgi:DNA processing protein